MSAAPEASLVYAFAALLGVGSVVLLFVPVLRHAWSFAASGVALLGLVATMLGLSIAAVIAVTYATSDPAYFLPVAAITVALRVVSPTLLYARVRDRLEAKRAWPRLRVLVAAAYVVLAGDLAYTLLETLQGRTPLGVAVLSEQLVMAIGASALIVRAAFRVRPRDTDALWPVWLAAIFFAIAFVIVAPYAFPAFGTIYLVSGLAGWIVGVALVRYLD